MYKLCTLPNLENKIYNTVFKEQNFVLFAHKTKLLMQSFCSYESYFYQWSNLVVLYVISVTFVSIWLNLWIFMQGAIEIDEDLLSNSARSLETLVYVGMTLGVSTKELSGNGLPNLESCNLGDWDVILWDTKEGSFHVNYIKRIVLVYYMTHIKAIIYISISCILFALICVNFNTNKPFYVILSVLSVGFLLII